MPRPASTKGCSQRSSDNPTMIGQNDGAKPQRRAALRGAATECVRGPHHEAVASTKGCSQRSSDTDRRADNPALDLPQRRAALRGAATPRDDQWPRLPDRPQRRAALRGAATAALLGRRRGIQRLNEGLLSEEQRPDNDGADRRREGASTKGCSQRSSDRRVRLALARLPHLASTKGCSQRSSDNPKFTDPASFTAPQRRAALRGAATFLRDTANSHHAASTKGCSQRSSD